MSSGGEFELIERLTRGLAGGAGVEKGVGDDCALLDTSGSELLLATCDSQVEGVHFTLRTSTPQQIGRKALAVNLSDIAAMGGIPRYALISLILPPQCPFLAEIYAGLREEAQQYATAIVGGNIATTGSSEQLIIDVTLLGTVERGRALLRGGARAGDLLCVTGRAGESAAGLHTLLHPNPAYAAAALEVVQARHRTPQPRLREGRILNRFGPKIVTALIDVSDGISGDLGHLCERSQLGARVEVERLPLSAPLRSIATTAAHDPCAWFLHGGEDYELLFTVMPDHAQIVIETIERETGTPVSIIGSMRAASEGLTLQHSDGQLTPLAIASWNHL